MTGRTHDLAAFTALNMVFVYTNVPQMTLATGVVALGANMIGGLLPDIDNATSDIWDKVRGGEIIAKVIKPLLGGHRMISHSILGLALIGYIVRYLLNAISGILIVDMNIVWWSSMIGYASHLVMDSLTREGIPWFFPFPIRMGFPPIKKLRVKTGSLVENAIIFPGLLILTGYLFYSNYPRYLTFFQSFIK